MTTEVTLDVAGARVTLPASTLTNLWLERVRGASAIVNADRPKILSQYGGGIYAGIVRGDAGGSDRHLIVLDGDREGITWQDATAWADGLGNGGRLPTRREQAVLFGNVPELFEQAWYWSGETHASVPAYAWFQSFDYGLQYYNLKGYRCRARAVRTIDL